MYISMHACYVFKSCTIQHAYVYNKIHQRQTDIQTEKEREMTCNAAYMYTNIAPA